MDEETQFKHDHNGHTPGERMEWTDCGGIPPLSELPSEQYEKYEWVPTGTPSYGGGCNCAYGNCNSRTQTYIFKPKKLK